ncbi:metalloregulator ArsR/SmtB family transcription factor [Methanohalophilus sp.]|uniref:ArsR/SmtB family transcription factor n=1 Tax=Methanohalophilus sp. TaxID=1966352 RepID=UPI00261AEAEA|nr:metalloregulator ArsR/SmtB family transcription factor [Methanohalophilus sp.]MDK2892166.1 ArsR family transcriptional regulator, lead/cadmium/zinc/bismuth-responsive transcriptional [Methanohalophilus sp.]
MEIPTPLECEIKGEDDLRKLAARLPDEESIQKQSKIYYALSSPLRIKILHLLTLNPLCVCLIKEIVNVQDSKLSYHLSILSDVGLIEGKREGNWIIYYPTEIGKDMVEKTNIF